MVGHLVDLGEQVARHDDRHIEHTRQLAQEGADLVYARRVEAVGRLVEQEQGRPAHERGGDAEALLHAEREVPDSFAAHGRVVEADDLQHLVDLGLGQSAQLPHDFEVLTRREVRVAARALDERSHVPQHLEAVLRREGRAQDCGRALRGVHEAEEHLHRG